MGSYRQAVAHAAITYEMPVRGTSIRPSISLRYNFRQATNGDNKGQTRNTLSISVLLWRRSRCLAYVQVGFSSVDGDGVTAAIQDSGKGSYRIEVGCRDGDVGAEGVAVGGGCVPGSKKYWTKSIII